ncbi:MAG: xanthine phosphoribosyltransferase [Clostridia bacterium]|jgi:xanthine phosphoribosyltransferase|nr:xanthine phosphoribosyltransferase [Clostridia bacterium]
MRLLEDRIRKDGKIKSGDVLRVDGFLNHMIDVRFVAELGAEFHRLFADCRVNKILTIESSGIGVACLTAQFFDCPVVFAKKSKTSNMDGDSYRVQIASYTHGNVNDVVVSKEYLGKGDRVLIIDDFLARGNALEGLIQIVSMSGAELVGAGIVIEKAYQDGGEKIRARGVRVESLARIASMSEEDGVVFCD